MSQAKHKNLPIEVGGFKMQQKQRNFIIHWTDLQNLDDSRKKDSLFNKLQICI